MSGVSPATVGRWRRSWPPIEIHWRPAHQQSYAYLLGLYLGDGCLHVSQRGRVLMRICLDAGHRAVIDAAWAAMQLSMPQARACVCPRKGARAVDVQGSTRLWLHAFPQHARGRKHERPIVLEPWQQDIVDRYSAEFIRGLIHSDGCRTTNRFTTRLPSGRVAEYAYGRYFFSNLSADIRGLFCSACDRLDVRWTQSNSRNISVAHRKSVALLDELGCGKD